MPEPTEVNWEVDVKRRVTSIEVDVKNLTATLHGEMEPIKSGIITKEDFDKIKNVVQKLLEA